MKVGFIGLGKLGLPCAIAIESKGHTVFGYDQNPKVKEYISSGEIPYQEEGMEILKDSNIEVYPLEKTIKESDIVFVAVQTPHRPMFEGSTPFPRYKADFDYTYLENAVANIASVVKTMKRDVVVVVISTVLPGTMEERIIPLIDKIDNFHLVYNPFFIAMGTTIRDFLHPEFILIGVHSKYAHDKLKQFYSSVIEERVFCVMDICSAEATKVLYNTFITQKIVFANAVGELCEATGADANSVMMALWSGHRRIISPMYMKPGMGDGGGCHPRDNIALSFIADKYGIHDIWGPMMKSRDEQTKNMAEYIVNTAVEFGFKKIFILGESFKTGTNITTGSPAILIRHFIREYLDATGIEREINIYDPHVYKSQVSDRRWGADIALYFIATNHECYKHMQITDGSMVIDPWGEQPHRIGVHTKYPGRHK